MATDLKNTGISPEVLADGEVVIAAVMSGKKVDAETARRIDERAEKITEEIRKKHGILDIAVPAIREFRDS